MRDDEYRATAKALARATRMSGATAERIEEKLLNALASRDVAQQAPVWLPALGGRSAVRWAAVAAGAALLIGASTFVWRVDKPTSVANTAHTALSSVVLPTVEPVERPAPPAKVVPPTSQVRQAAVRKATPKSRVIRPVGFIELPWTAGLPAFESGEIVRVEVPVASLPAYGFDISTGTNPSVEADVLVGQDGLARAMRLVSNNARSTQ